MIRLRVASSPGEHRIIAEDGGVLHDVAIWRPSRPDGLGDIYRARVIAHVPSMAGAFLGLPGGTDGFLPDSEGGKGALAGALLTVRVTRAAQGGKGPRLSAKLAHPDGVTGGEPGLVTRGPGPIDELADRYPEAPILVDDPALAAQLRNSLGVRLQLVPRAHDQALVGALDALAQPEAALPGGLRALIYPTPALVAIDIDMAAGTAVKQAKGIAQRRANEGAIRAIARQIRLRNLSGAILIDFAGMSAKARPLLAPPLQEALASDPLRPRLLGFTALGLAEIVRLRARPPLHELLDGPYAAGLRALAEIAREAAAAPHVRFRLRASPDIVSALEGDPDARADLARRLGRPLIVSSDPALPAGATSIERDR